MKPSPDCVLSARKAEQQVYASGIATGGCDGVNSSAKGRHAMRPASPQAK